MSQSQLPYCMADALARPSGQGRPEIISPVIASSGTVAGLFSLLGAHEVRVWATLAVPRLRAGFVMACRISELVLGCRDPEVLARFWCEVLDFVVLDREEDGSVGGMRAMVKGSVVRSRRSSSVAGMSRRRGNPGCTSTSTPPTAIRTPSSNAFEAWCAPGRHRPAGREQWHVLVDPEGNEFCLLKARLDPL